MNAERCLAEWDGSDADVDAGVVRSLPVSRLCGLLLVSSDLELVVVSNLLLVLRSWKAA